MSAIYYFGCWPAKGHHLRSPDGENQPRDAVLGRGQVRARLDGGFCPGATPDGYAPSESQVEGLAVLHHVEGWTVLAFWDRSVDTRPGSHSTFLAEGTHEAEVMLALARDTFPSVWARYPFQVRVLRVVAEGGAGAKQGGA